MVAFGHTAVGTLVGLGVYHYTGSSNPALAVLTSGGVGLISHYIADAVPHGHFFPHKDFKRKVIWAILFDFLLSVLLFSGLVLFIEGGLTTRFWCVLFAIGGSQLPDILDGWYYLGVIPNKGIFKAENKFHQSMHWHAIFKNGKLVTGLPMRKSDIWQLGMVGLALFAVFR